MTDSLAIFTTCRTKFMIVLSLGALLLLGACNTAPSGPVPTPVGGASGGITVKPTVAPTINPEDRVQAAMYNTLVNFTAVIDGKFKSIGDQVGGIRSTNNVRYMEFLAKDNSFRLQFTLPSTFAQGQQGTAGEYQLVSGTIYLGTAELPLPDKSVGVALFVYPSPGLIAGTQAYTANIIGSIKLVDTDRFTGSFKFAADDGEGHLLNVTGSFATR